MRLMKKAVEIGNGAAVYVPKEYSGKNIIVILPEGIEEIKNRVLNRLIEFMPNILGVYLFGSYARGEQVDESDIDILVITKEKDDNIKKSLNDIDLRVVPIDTIKKTIKNFPLLIVPIIRESNVLLNPILLEELNNISINFKRFKWNFEDINRIIKIIKKFVELDDKNISSSHIYSLIMRIRVCFLIECLLKNKKFSNSSVNNLLESYKLNQQEINNFFRIYRAVRDNKEYNVKVNKEEIIKLIEILEDYSTKIEHETKKKTEKRN